jgi:hypothetical protein
MVSLQYCGYSILEQYNGYTAYMPSRVVPSRALGVSHMQRVLFDLQLAILTYTEQPRNPD